MEYAFWKSFNMPIIQAHSMNIFAERQHVEKFVPMVVRRILKKEKVSIHGIKSKDISSRCWIHAREVCNGLLFLLENGKIGESYNIIGEEKSVLDLANWVSQSINKRPLKDNEIDWVDYHTTRPGHDLRYALDGGKIKELGWTPSISLKDSFDKMVQWMVQPENLKWLNL